MVQPGDREITSFATRMMLEWVSREVHDLAVFVAQFVFLFEEGLHQDAFGHLTVAWDGVAVVDRVKSPHLDGVAATRCWLVTPLVTIAALVSRPEIFKQKTIDGMIF